MITELKDWSILPISSTSSNFWGFQDHLVPPKLSDAELNKWGMEDSMSIYQVDILFRVRLKVS
jgi:hypothetical protein